jgi:nicotinamidase/pyrazinamidase
MGAVLIEADPNQQRHEDYASPDSEESTEETGCRAEHGQLEEPYRIVSVHCRDVRTTVDWMEFAPGTALLVIDVQNDFADPTGSLYVQGGEQVIPFINEQIAAAVKGGATVVYSQDWHPESTPHFAKDGGIWPVHCVAGTSGAEFHPDLDVIEDAIFVKTGVGGEDGYSAFNVRDPVTGAESSTGLADDLEGLTTAVVLGLALDYCVKETALDAARIFDQTTVLADGTRAVDLQPGDGARAVAALVEAGVSVV